MESEQHLSSLSSHQHDFSSLVSWPHHWHPESFEITTTTTNHTSILTISDQMTQVVPEHVARAKISSGGSASSSSGGDGITNNNNNNNKSTRKNRLQRSNSATLSTISVTCDTDTSIRSRNNRHQQSPSSKDTLISNNNNNNISTSRSSTALMNISVKPPPTSFRNHHQYKSGGNSSSPMSTSLTTASGMNIIHEKSSSLSSSSTMSIPNKHSIKEIRRGGGGGAGALGGSTISTKSLSNKYKATSFDDDHHRRANQSRGIGKSVLEHLVFVFPENVRRILAGPKNLTVRSEDNRQQPEPIDLGEPPSVEEVKGWAESFDKLMLSPAGRRYFRDFLRSEYSEENFLFWMSCESLKNEQNPEIIEEKARLIYEDYISILSPKEVSLDSRVREVINKNMVEPSPHTFDEAQLQIYTLMHRDSYPRFINSQMYRRLLRNEGEST